MCSSFVEAVDCCRLLCALERSSFVKAVVVKAVESVAVEAVDCFKLLCALVLLKLLNLLLKMLITICALESSSFVEAVESIVVEAVDCCRLLCALESSSFVDR